MSTTTATQESSSKKDVLTRLDSLVTGVPTSNDDTDATKSVSDIFAKISRDKRKTDKPEKPSGPQSILRKPEPESNGEPEKKAKRSIR
jgi:hypothetical protein